MRGHKDVVPRGEDSRQVAPGLYMKGMVMWKVSGGPTFLIIGEQAVNLDKVEHVEADAIEGGTRFGMTSGKRLTFPVSVFDVLAALKKP